MKSTKMPVNNEQHGDGSELQHMMTNEQQQQIILDVTVSNHRLNIQSWWSRTSSTVKMKIFVTVLLLLAIVCGSGIVLITRHASQTNNADIVEEKGDITEIRDWNGEKMTMVEDEMMKEEVPQQLNSLNNHDYNERTDDQIPRLRSYVEHERSASPESIGHMNIYIRGDTREDSRPSYERFRFPVARYSRRRMPFGGPFTSFLPWIPIFADPRTKQTIIYSQTGGVYIIPPLINFYGRMFSIGELVASGYASLVSSGVQPGGAIDMTRFFQQSPLIGPSIPVINPLTGGFRGGLRTDFGSFSISRRYETRPDKDSSVEEEDEDEYDNNRPAPKPYNKPDKKYPIPKKPTVQETISTSQPVVTQCQPSTSTNFIKTDKASKATNGPRKVKMQRISRELGSRALLNDTYLVEFASDACGTDHFEKIADTLQHHNKIARDKIKKRRTIHSRLFCGVSISVTGNASMEAVEALDDVINIHRVYLVHVPRPGMNSIISNTLNGNDVGPINSYDLTGVTDVHKKLNNFGKGVRVAVIDSGIDYSHPALGGCFGPGCKVAFGYDLVGDAYDPANGMFAKPDEDPLDNCSRISHGTHIAGIIAANATGITATGFISLVPFIGVAPQVTLGAYRVFGCSFSSVATDVVTEAIYRAHDDNADIITVSIGFTNAYGESSVSIAAQQVSNMGVYVTFAFGNSGNGGLQTTADPAVSPGVMGVGSADSTHTVKYIISAPDGKKIYYQLAVPGGGWQSNTRSIIVVNDPNRGPSDGCSGPAKSVMGVVILFFRSAEDSCNATVRCDKAALQGAIGCLLYGVSSTEGALTIPTGNIDLTEGLSLVAAVTANPSGVYTFTNLFELRPVETGGTPSYFTSLGLSGDLLFKPDISGIGGYVYSTISSYAAVQQKSATAYAVYFGTSFACPFVAGTLALFLANIGNPAPNTVSGHAENGICRPKFSEAMNIFQSTTTIMKIFNTSLFATTAQQGAGLVNVHRALTTSTMFSPAKLGLNDTVRKASSYKVKVFNIGHKTAIYKMSHRGAALATGARLNDDQLLNLPLYTDDYADVIIEPTKFELSPGQSREITLRFRAPDKADSALLPIYSGFIYATNQNGETVHLSYAGVKGNYAEARIYVRTTPSGIISGIKDANGNYASNEQVSTMNATQGLTIIIVIAYATRVSYVDVVLGIDDVLPGYNPSYGLVFTVEVGPLYGQNIARNVATNTTEAVGYVQSYPFSWHGAVSKPILNGHFPPLNIDILPPGLYKIRFSALKHFGNYTNPNDFEVYETPPFNLVF